MLEQSEQEAIEGILPDHLKDGWKCYRDWWIARYRAGDPLPPGGVFILNKRAILLDELFVLHVEAAAGLKVPFEAVKVDLDIDAMGRPVPKVDITPPDGWGPDLPKRVIMEGGDRQKLAQDYVSGYLNVLYNKMRERLAIRVKSLTSTRPDVAPKEIISEAPATASGIPTVDPRG